MGNLDIVTGKKVILQLHLNNDIIEPNPKQLDLPLMDSTIALIALGVLIQSMNAAAPL